MSGLRAGVIGSLLTGAAGAVVALALGGAAGPPATTPVAYAAPPVLDAPISVAAPASYADVVERVAPAVVTIRTEAVVRTDMTTRQQIDVSPQPQRNDGGPVGELRYRFNWNAPIVASPHDPSVVYFAGNVVFRTRDFGDTWEVVSPDLTTSDPLHQDFPGGPITRDGTGVAHGQAPGHRSASGPRRSPTPVRAVPQGPSEGPPGRYRLP